MDSGAALESGQKWNQSYVDGVKGVARGLGLEKCEQALEQVGTELADSDWLTPQTHFTFTANQPSPPRYIKGRVVAVLKKLKGQSEHY